MQFISGSNRHQSYFSTPGDLVSDELGYVCRQPGAGQQTITKSPRKSCLLRGFLWGLSGIVLNVLAVALLLRL
jgi:hypothetical protein